MVVAATNDRSAGMTCNRRDAARVMFGPGAGGRSDGAGRTTGGSSAAVTCWARRLFASRLSRDFTIGGSKQPAEYSARSRYPYDHAPHARLLVTARNVRRLDTLNSASGIAEHQGVLSSSFVSDGIRQRALVPKNSWQQKRRRKSLSSRVIPRSEVAKCQNQARYACADSA
jgi:hypothetical protein